MPVMAPAIVINYIQSAHSAIRATITAINNGRTHNIKQELEHRQQAEEHKPPVVGTAHSVVPEVAAVPAVVDPVAELALSLY